jgi:hypothetical protein
MPSLSEIQDAFATALLDRSSPVPAFLGGSARRRPERRFAIYRNNAAAGLVTALATRFPVVQRLTGDEFFRAMAHAYASTELPRSPLMLYYGETFPAFIEGFAPAAPIPYLADIARIEMARGLAYHAADASTLEAEEFAAIPKDRLGALRVQLHPSVSIIASDYPVYSIWHVNQDPERFAPVSFFKRESVLIARPYLRVKTQCISREIAEFVRALAAGSSLAEAVDITSAADALTFLIKARIVTALNGAQALHH